MKKVVNKKENHKKNRYIYSEGVTLKHIKSNTKFLKNSSKY